MRPQILGTGVRGVTDSQKDIRFFFPELVQVTVQKTLFGDGNVFMFADKLHHCSSKYHFGSKAARFPCLRRLCIGQHAGTVLRGLIAKGLFDGAATASQNVASPC